MGNWNWNGSILLLAHIPKDHMYTSPGNVANKVEFFHISDSDARDDTMGGTSWWEMITRTCERAVKASRERARKKETGFLTNTVLNISRLHQAYTGWERARKGFEPYNGSACRAKNLRSKIYEADNKLPICQVTLTQDAFQVVCAAGYYQTIECIHQTLK